MVYRWTGELGHVEKKKLSWGKTQLGFSLTHGTDEDHTNGSRGRLKKRRTTRE